MEKQVKMWHLIVAIVILATSWVGSWVNVKENQAEHASAILEVRAGLTELRNTQKLDAATGITRHYELIKAINDLRIIVENKQNRQ